MNYKWPEHKLTPGGKSLFISKAPEPNDIIWTNICNNMWRNYLLRSITMIIVAALLVASYFTNYYILKWT